MTASNLPLPHMPTVYDQPKLKSLPLREQPAYRVSQNADACNLTELLAAVIGGQRQIETSEALLERFDGDIRRFPGRNFAHGSSTKSYNRLMERFVDEYVQVSGSAGLTAFLEQGMSQLREKHRAIVGRKMVVPKIRVEKV